MTTPLDPALRAALPDLAERQIAWIRARLDERGAALWREAVLAAWAACLDAPLGALVDADALADALDAALARALVEGALRPVVERSLPVVRARLLAERRPARALVPDSAVERLAALVSRPDAVPARVVHEVLEQDAVQAVFDEVLYDALRAFQTKVNPFFAEWGLPALLKRVMPIGAGAVMKSLESVKAEFDRRLEPEIRRFLTTFSRAALARAASEVVRQQGDARFVGLRREVLRWVLDQPLADLVAQHDESFARELQASVLEIVAANAAREDLRAERRARIRAFVDERRERALRQVLADLGVTHEPDLASIAAATWPAVHAVLASEPVSAIWARELRAFWDELA